MISLTNTMTYERKNVLICYSSMVVHYPHHQQRTELSSLPRERETLLFM